MQSFAGLMAAIVLAASGPAAQHSLLTSNAGPETSEVYVAELDADWNVSREVRQTCALELGCTVDLGLTKGGLGRVHVRFDAVHAGSIAVNSVLEDHSGNAAAQPALTLSLDQAGFGAGHYEAAPVAAATPGTAAPASPGAEQPIILMAVRVPGWVAPASSRGDQT